MGMKRLLLGTWRLPSGNTLEALLEVSPGDSPHTEARCEWQNFPPSEKDADFYREHIAPELYQRYAEVLCPGGRMLVVQR